MTNIPKVTVIIPIYGVEKYIEKCAHSLFKQTLTDMQFIFVNDCTPDNSLRILESVLDSYPERKSQTLILNHIENKGLPIARKTGIQAATGEFIAHCDSDDWVDCNLYEEMYDAAIRYNADVSICNCNDIINENFIVERSGGRYNLPHLCINEMMHGKMWWSLCNKLFRRNCYHKNIIYPKDGMGEDMCLTLQLMTQCSNVVYINNARYNYLINPNSMVQITTKKSCLKKFEELERNVNNVIQYYRSCHLDTKYQKGLNYISYKIKYHIYPLLGDKFYYNLWRKTFPKSEINVIFDMKAPIKDRIIALLTVIGIFPYPRNKYEYLLKDKN